MIVCLDLEGVLVPEIWIGVSKKTGIKELSLTTRDIPDYDKLMAGRIKILRQHGIKLSDVQQVIAKIRPLPGAFSFLKTLRKKKQVIILSDTFYEFAGPLMNQLENPTIFCNYLKISKDGFIDGFTLRQRDGKQKAVKAIQSLGFEVKASGDSYNDLTMLQAADHGVLFNPPASIMKQYPKIPVTKTYSQLLKHLL